MSDRLSRLALFVRHFLAVLAIMLVITRVFNALSGMNMFPLVPVVFAALILTVMSTVIGWIVVTGGMETFHGNDPSYKEWKARGGRPYWDTLGWPINRTTPRDR